MQTLHLGPNLARVISLATLVGVSQKRAFVTVVLYSGVRIPTCLCKTVRFVMGIVERMMGSKYAFVRKVVGFKGKHLIREDLSRRRT